MAELAWKLGQSCHPGATELGHRNSHRAPGLLLIMDDSSTTGLLNHPTPVGTEAKTKTNTLYRLFAFPKHLGQIIHGFIFTRPDYNRFLLSSMNSKAVMASNF